MTIMLGTLLEFSKFSLTQKSLGKLTIPGFVFSMEFDFGAIFLYLCLSA